MARPRLLIALVAALALPGAAQAATRADWDKPAQRDTVEAGYMAALPGGFQGERALSAAQLRQALAVISAANGVPAVTVPGGPVTLERFHKLVVAQLGLTDMAEYVHKQARGAGLHPPRRFGTEVVARQLGLRFNHPFGQEQLELYPWDRITRAEAAWSFAKIAGEAGSSVPYARQVLAQLVLERPSAKRLHVLRSAVSKIGMPYVWGGETDRPSRFFGGQAHGGYDCSGFVWRVFKLTGNPAGRSIQGRTAASQAGEIPRSTRLRMDAVAPGDLLFFGPAGFSSAASERGIVHEGIALSRQFMIHASSQGVYVSPLFERWRTEEFSWARRFPGA